MAVMLAVGRQSCGVTQLGGICEPLIRRFKQGATCRSSPLMVSWNHMLV